MFRLLTHSVFRTPFQIKIEREEGTVHHLPALRAYEILRPDFQRESECFLFSDDRGGDFKKFIITHALAMVGPGTMCDAHGDTRTDRIFRSTFRTGLKGHHIAGGRLDMSSKTAGDSVPELFDEKLLLIQLVTFRYRGFAVIPAPGNLHEIEPQFRGERFRGKLRDANCQQHPNHTWLHLFSCATSESQPEFFHKNSSYVLYMTLSHFANESTDVILQVEKHVRKTL